MPRAGEIAVPNSSAVLLRSADCGVAIENVEHGVGGMREDWNPYPSRHLAGRGIVLLQLVVQLRYAAGIGAEYDVVTSGAGHVAAIRDGGQLGIGGAKQKWEV